MITKSNYILFIIIICSSLQLVSQTNSPTNGKIVFVKKTKIYDTVAFEASKEKFKIDFINALRTQIIKEKQLSNEKIDSSKVESSLKFFKLGMNNLFFKQLYNTKNYEMHHKFQDSLIISYKKIEGKIIGDYIVINKNKNTFNSLAKIDSTTTFNKNTIYKQNNTLLDIKEFRNETKNINGYECFKITFSTEEVLDNVFKLKQKNTFYVTEHIKSNYHPVTRFKLVLDKYYPLEIYEEDEGINGVRTEYKIKEINILY